MYKLATKGITATILTTAVCGFFSSTSLACCWGWCGDSEEEVRPQEARRLMQEGTERPAQPSMYQQPLLQEVYRDDPQKQASARSNVVVGISEDPNPVTIHQKETVSLYKAGKIKKPIWDALGQQGPLADKLKSIILSVKHENAVFENIIKKSDTVYKLEMYVGVDKAIELIYMDR